LSATVHSHNKWPRIAGVRLQGKINVPYSVDCVDLDKTYGKRFDVAPELSYIRFRHACDRYEQVHGELAANDYRETEVRQGPAVLVYRGKTYTCEVVVHL
jgi:hypothetical protein